MPVVIMVQPHYETGMYPHGAFCRLQDKPNDAHDLHDECAISSLMDVAADPVPVFVEMFSSRVLNIRELNVPGGRDSYVLVWNETLNAPREYLYASTRGGSRSNSAQVDACHATRRKYQDFVASAVEAVASAGLAMALPSHHGHKRMSLWSNALSRQVSLLAGKTLTVKHRASPKLLPAHNT